MGTKVHYRSYIPGHAKMKDLNVDAGNGWPPFYISKTLNEHFYNDCLLSPFNGYSEYDKEMLKRTMLEHEAIFRKQVYELHRLYSIQKDLMVEFQKNGSSGSSKHEVPSKTSSYTSQVQSDYAPRMFQISHLHAMNNSQEKGKARYNIDNISPINFLERNLQSSCGFLETEARQRVAELDVSFRNPKTMLGLQLPACGYVDDTESSKEPFLGSSSLNTFTCSRICKRDSEIELKLNLSIDSGSMGKDICKLNNHHTKNLFTSLIDSNDSNEHSFLDGASDSFPVQAFGQRTQKEDNHGLNCLSLSSTKLNLQNAFPKGRGCHERAFSNGFQEAKDETCGGTVCYNESGKSHPSPHKGKSSMFCEPIRLDVKEASGIISTDHNVASTRFIHEEGDHFQIRHSDLGKLPSVVPNPSSTSRNLDSTVTCSPLGPTWVKISGDENHASRPFPATPTTTKLKNLFISGTSTEDHNAASGYWQVGRDLHSPLRFEDNSSSHVNGLNDGFLFQSHSTLHDSQKLKFPFITKNLNVDAEISFSGIRNRLNAQQNKAASSIDGKFEEPSRLPSHLDLLSTKNDRVHEWKTEISRSLPSCNLEISSSLQKRECEIKINPQSDSLSTTKFIVSNFEHNLVSSSNEENLVTEELMHASMSCEIRKCSSGKSTSVDNNIRNSRNYIDLNSVFPITDDPDSSDSSTKVQAEFTSIHSDPIPDPGIVTLVDLEEPVNNIAPMRLQEELCSHEMLIKEAAENIVKLSLDEFKHKDVINGSSLYLFAELILSNQNIIRSNETLCNRFDFFELMTLQLEEMKPEKLWCRTWEVENRELDKWSKASMLLAKPRRAQGRKRRQRKDFQKDILPSLATLSRRETVEDLRVIGELMKASGLSWQVGTGRRKARRNGAQPRAIQKRRRINAPAAVPVLQINTPTSVSMADDNDNPEFEVDRHDMLGWGRTTRRCRSQRSHPISISTSLM